MMESYLYIIWNVRPEIFQLGSFGMRWYGFLFAMGFIVAYKILEKIFPAEGRLVKDLDVLTIYVVAGTVLGARLGHTLFYEPNYYLQHPMEILKIWEGGLASHGAVIGMFTAIYLYSRKFKESYLWVLDRVAITVPIAGCLVRLGNLMNSEMIGKESNVPWAFIFVSHDNVPRHPGQLYEAILYFCLFFIILAYYRIRRDKTAEGSIIGILLIGIFTIRFAVEFVKEDQVDFEQGMALNMGQLLSIPLIIAGIILYVYSQRRDSIGKHRTENNPTI